MRNRSAAAITAILTTAACAGVTPGGVEVPEPVASSVLISKEHHLRELSDADAKSREALEKLHAVLPYETTAPVAWSLWQWRSARDWLCRAYRDSSFHVIPEIPVHDEIQCRVAMTNYLNDQLQWLLPRPTPIFDGHEAWAGCRNEPTSYLLRSSLRKQLGPSFSVRNEEYSCFRKECWEGVLHHVCLYVEKKPIAIVGSYTASASQRFVLFQDDGDGWSVVDRFGRRYGLGKITGLSHFENVEWKEYNDRVAILLDGEVVAEFQPGCSPGP